MSDLSLHEQAENEMPNNSTATQILIAEDEPVIRRLLQKLLNLWGYRTLVAHDGKQAMEVAAKHPGDIDLLLSDVTMPGMDGVELAAKMTKNRPALKVILMSGFCHFNVAVQRGWQFIQKPFRPSEIKETIEKTL